MKAPSPSLVLRLVCRGDVHGDLDGACREWRVRTGRRSGLIASYAAAAAGAGLAVAGILIQPLLVVAGLFLLGVGGAGAQLARYAGAELYPDARRGFALGAVVWVGTLGAVGGPALLAVTASAAEQVGLPPLAEAFLLALLAAAVAGLATCPATAGAGMGRGIPWPGRTTAPGRPLRRVLLIDLGHADQLAQIVATLTDLRQHGTAPYDIAVALRPGTDPEPYVKAGATWWMPDFPPEVTLDLVRGVMHDGPYESKEHQQ